MADVLTDWSDLVTQVSTCSGEYFRPGRTPTNEQRVDTVIAGTAGHLLQMTNDYINPKCGKSSGNFP